MRKSLTYKILAAVMALSAANWAVPANVLAGEDANGNYNVTYDGETISDSYDSYKNVYGNGHSFTIDGDTVIYGYVYGVGNGNYDKDVSGGNVTINGNAYIAGAVYGGRSGKGEAYNNTVNISDGSVGDSLGDVYGGRSTDGNAHHNTVNISDGSVGGSLGEVYGGMSGKGEAYNNTVNISGGTVKSDVYGGRSTDGSAHHNTVNISDGSVTSYVYGGRSTDGSAHHNTVNISDGSVTSYVYGGRSTSGNAYDNEVIISGSANIENASLYGRNSDAHGTGNTLTIDGWSGRTNSVKNFNDIAFKNIDWNNNESILTITNQNNYTSDLTNTTIDTINIAGGSNINVGESMTLIKSENNTNLGLTEGNVTDTFTAGVAREGLGSTSIDGNGNVTFKVNSIKLSSQAVGAAQTRAASAAFVNQGTDLINDSLDVLGRDGTYGVKMQTTLKLTAGARL